MRQIGTIPSEQAARTLADYLLTRGMETRLEPGSGGWEVWVCDEDQLAKAKEELAEFTANPTEPRFTSASRAAAEIRRAEEQADESYRRRQVALGERFRRPAATLRPVTGLLIAACLVVAFLTSLGSTNNALMEELYITWFKPEPALGPGMGMTPGLRPIFAPHSWRNWEVWRLVTPIFLHFGFLHLAGNLFWLYYLGTPIEARRGSLRFLALVLSTAVVSNLAQYLLGGLVWNGGQFETVYSGNFGGMSGVVFGLFGYTWMKMRFAPELGLGISQQVFVLTLMWLVFCFTGLAGPVANFAHAAGLAFGIAVGAGPTLFRRLWH